MANLAIKGHPTRGKEVIQLLEMLGANRLGYKDTFIGFYYYIECGAICSSDEYPTYSTIFALEEFLEKYPYKVGDQVIAYAEGILASFSIKGMRWNNKLNKVEYKICSSWYDVSMLSAIQPYTDYDIKTNKEEDKDMSEHTSEINLNHPCFNGHDKIELIIPENWKFEQRGNKMFGVRKYPQYPKTYEECCKMLGYSGNYNMTLTTDVDNKLFNALYRLKVCRDAYWKIAGDWRPEFRFGKKKYCIMTKDNKVISATVEETNRIFVFPTEEMRDVFYDAFEELINEVKELL